MPNCARAAVEKWHDAGIRVEIELEEENEYWAQKRLEADLGVTWNKSHWQDERLDALIDFACSALEADARIAA